MRGILIKLISLFLLLGVLSPSLANQTSLTNLESEANKVLSNPDNVARRKEIGVVFKAAESFVANGQTNKAIDFYQAALVHEPWNLRAQLALAGLLKSVGKTNAFRQKAQLVWNYAETDTLQLGAAKLLGLSVVTEMPNDRNKITTPTAIVLIPLKDTDIWLMGALRDGLADVLGVPVTIRQYAIEVGLPNRDPIHVQTELLRRRFDKSKDDPQFRAMLKEFQLSFDDLGSDETVLNLVRKILDKDPDKEPLKRFNSEIDELRRLGPQWDAGELTEKLSKTVGAQSGAGIAYLGVANLDIYSESARFVFGVALRNDNCGIISYRRFSSLVLDTPPNRQKLRERTLKQALSSIGLMYGLPRCSDPTCARAYANSLDEFDAKQLKLCSDCKAAFEKRFGR